MTTEKGFLQDEQGNRSLARGLLVTAFILTYPLVYLDAVSHIVDVPSAAYGLLATIFTGLLVWTAGPRIAQYVGPQLAGIASGLASAARTVRNAVARRSSAPTGPGVLAGNELDPPIARGRPDPEKP